jgi:pyruvate-ferredoxin/flavodoxin oxidoreductase
MIKAVFDNQLKDKPKEHFTVGINDDVYHSSLDVVPLEEPTLQSDFVQCINWGFGGDGSIGAMSSTTKIIAENAVKFVALNNVYDSKKEAGATVSHLRFGPSPITSEYPISQDADFISCSKETYASKYNMLKPLKKGGKFLLNTTLTSVEEFEKQYPPKFLRQIAKKNAKVFILDAQKVAREVGMPKRTNTVMQVAFFKLSGILPGDSALDLLINDLKYRYKKHGPKIVD